MKRVIRDKTMAIALAVAAAAVALPRAASPQTAAAPASAEATKRGEAWFYQRCSLCHMGRIVKDDVVRADGSQAHAQERDARAREGRA